MSDTISSIAGRFAPVRGIEKAVPEVTKQGTGPQGISFSDYLKNQINETEKYAAEGDRLVEANLKGELDDPQQLILSFQKADVSFRLLLSVKDKLEQAYQTLLRTQIG